jgi:hypothetical protein
MAPEIWDGLYMPAAVDWFACGTTLFGLFTGLMAFTVCSVPAPALLRGADGSPGLASNRIASHPIPEHAACAPPAERERRGVSRGSPGSVRVLARRRQRGSGVGMSGPPVSECIVISHAACWLVKACADLRRTLLDAAAPVADGPQPGPPPGDEGHRRD